MEKTRRVSDTIGAAGSTGTNSSGVRAGLEVKDITVMGMFTAIILILAFTPLGLIDLPLIKATILHIPVIIGAILLGPKKGAYFGAVFGLTSFISNTLKPAVLSFAFTPAAPVPGTGRGSVWALFICFVPRILVGVTPWLFYTLTTGLFSGGFAGGIHTGIRAKGLNPAVKTVLLALSGAVGAMTNTLLVMGSIYFIFRQAYADVKGIAVTEVRNVILGVIAANGIPEMLAAVVLTPIICLALMKTGIFHREARA